nr:unnamed protein product [Callosobruchus analis]
MSLATATEFTMTFTGRPFIGTHLPRRKTFNLFFLTELFNAKMSLKLTANDFEVCDRVGRKEGKNRGIFVKIASTEKRNLIYAKKKHQDS